MKRRNNNYEITKAVYRLKKSHGDYVLLQIIDETDDVNFTTGRKNTKLTQYPIYRAVPIGVSIEERFAYDLAYIAADKNFTYGAHFAQFDRVFLIDGKDLPRNFDIDQFNRIVYEGLPYCIEKVAKTGDGQSYFCGCKTFLTNDIYAHAQSILNLCEDGVAS